MVRDEALHIFTLLADIGEIHIDERSPSDRVLAGTVLDQGTGSLPILPLSVKTILMSDAHRNRYPMRGRDGRTYMD